MPLTHPQALQGLLTTTTATIPTQLLHYYLQGNQTNPRERLHLVCQRRLKSLTKSWKVSALVYLRYVKYAEYFFEKFCLCWPPVLYLPYPHSVCVCARARACSYVYIHIRTFIYMNIHLCIYAFWCTRIQTHTHTHTHKRILTHTFTHTHKRTNVRIN